LNEDGELENLVIPVVEFTWSMEILRTFPNNREEEWGEHLFKYVDETSSKLLTFIVKQEGGTIKKSLLTKSSHLMRDLSKIKKLLKGNFGSYTLHMIHKDSIVITLWKFNKVWNVCQHGVINPLSINRIIKG